MVLARNFCRLKLPAGMTRTQGLEQVTIRAARRDDAAAVAELANELNRLHDQPENFTAEKVLADGFDATVPYALLVAERDGRVVGYALYHPQYNTDVPGWGLWLVDLMVAEAERRNGIGRALLARVAAEAKTGGYVSVWWAVLSRNRKARAFYNALGAKDEDARILELEGDALAQLASKAT